MRTFFNWVDVREIVRFGIAGGTNTVLTLAIYQGLLLFVSYGIAYAITLVCGLLFSMVFYPNKVFRAINTSTFKRVAVAAIYLTIYFVGLIMLYVIDNIGINPRLSIFLVLPITASLAYGSLRLLLRTQGRRAQ